jgi:hypothetical protein
MKTKEQGWKENHGIQNIGIEDFQGNIIIDQNEYCRFGRTILQSFMIKLIDQNT